VPRAELAVFDLTGRLVRTLHHGGLDAGAHRYAWDGRTDDGGRAPAGIYLLSLDTSVGSVARRVLRLQ
jgi:flagellar hook assembly protein FlgD